MQIVDTFSGIGGFSLAGEWMGWRTIQFCEINPFCQKVLSYYWPSVPIHSDIKTLTADQIKNNGLYDPKESTILVGGVPCQPWSSAGKRLGKEDDRNLWPQSIKLISELQPDFALLENVRGFTNWNGGMVFDQVQADLEAEGYEVLPFLLPACAVNAPHRRDRIWIIAYSENIRGSVSKLGEKKSKQQLQTGRNFNGFENLGTTAHAKSNRGRIGGIQCRDEKEHPVFRDTSQSWTTPDTERIGQQGQGRTERPSNSEAFRNWKASWSYDDGRWPTQPPVRSRNDGLPAGLSGITVSKHRKESIMAYGNAIVPQVAFEIFKVINALSKNTQ